MATSCRECHLCGDLQRGPPRGSREERSQSSVAGGNDGDQPARGAASTGLVLFPHSRDDATIPMRRTAWPPSLRAFLHHQPWRVVSRSIGRRSRDFERGTAILARLLPPSCASASASRHWHAPTESKRRSEAP